MTRLNVVERGVLEVVVALTSLWHPYWGILALLRDNYRGRLQKICHWGHGDS